MTGQLSDLYGALSHVLAYPNSEYRQQVSECKDLMGQFHPDQSNSFEEFAGYVSGVTDTKLEENYVSTFDVYAKCCLDVGYALFGEDYKRGQFMAQLKVMYQDHKVDMGTELPDFLPSLLKLIPKLDYADGTDLVEHAILPALEKMMEEFKDGENMYRFPLGTIQHILKSDYSIH